MNDRLNGKPVTFDHPEKLTEGISLVKGDVTAKSFISEVDGEVKCNIVIENKATGEIAKRDEVIGEIVENEEVDRDSNLDLDSGLYSGFGLGMGSSIGLASGLGSGIGMGLGSGIGLDLDKNKNNN